MELVGFDQCLNWLVRKQVSGGFSLAKSDGEQGEYDVRVIEEPKVRGIRGGRPVIFGSVLFEGHLVVTEPEVLRAAMVRGLGTAKAYGFGLLSVGRVA